MATQRISEVPLAIIASSVVPCETVTSVDAPLASVVVVVVVCDVCIVAKRCVLEQKLLLTAYRMSYLRNRLVPK